MHKKKKILKLQDSTDFEKALVSIRTRSRPQKKSLIVKLYYYVHTTHTSLLTSVEFTMDNLLKLKKERKKNISSPLCINLHCIFKLILQLHKKNPTKMKKRR